MAPSGAAAAILLVAGGGYPEVVVANLDDAVTLAATLASDAARRHVRLAVPVDGPRAIVVTRR